MKSYTFNIKKRSGVVFSLSPTRGALKLILFRLVIMLVYKARPDDAIRLLLMPCGRTKMCTIA